MKGKKIRSIDAALAVFEYNKAMLTCDMSISRDPEQQDVTPDYYGKDAEDLYYAIVCVEKYIKNAIPIEWIKNYARHNSYWHFWEDDVLKMVAEWEKENATTDQRRYADCFYESGL